ncbi:MAG: replication initiation protein, partial [Acidobacteriota bacterium]|nr:replication initiation protein [Acidobacteriota bacterium]
LVKYWEEKGRSITFTSFSLQRLAKILRRKWGKNVRESLKESLTRLRITPFIWENSYFDKETGETVEIEGDPFTILSELKTVRRKKDGHTTSEAGYFRFHDAIVRNLRANHTKPVFLEVVLSFKSEIAQLLYTHLDLILWHKAHYELRTKELFEDLGLDGKTYKNLSDRKRALERALKELRGVHITSGVITTAALEPTKDEEDYKVVFRRGRAIKVITEAEPEPEPARPAAPTEDKRTAEARALVSHFHKVFFGASKSHPTSKAIDQAVMLIARQGTERARYLIEFSHREAPHTKHDIKTFGGIFQYETQALAEYDRKQEQRAEVKVKEIKADLEKARERHKISFDEAYSDYLGEREAEIKTTHPNDYQVFEEYLSTPARVQTMRHLKLENLRRLTVELWFAEFFRDHDKCRVLDFWQWDAEINPGRFQK